MFTLGGGPPPSDDDDDAVMTQMKKIIEPQIDGLFTIYDGDALLMKQFQETIPEKDRIEPIESTYISNFGMYVFTYYSIPICV